MKARILIVEDNLDLLRILRDVFEREYEVATARRGEEALEEAARARPAVVILDLALPSMNGIETGRWLKKSPGPPIPILVLTGFTNAGDRRTILGSGCCDAYMAKPARLADIRDEVRRLLDRAA